MIAGIFRLFLVLSVFVFNASVIAAQGVVNDSLEVSLIAPVEGNYSGDLLFNASSGDGVSSVWFGYAAPGDNVTWLPATKRTDGYWTYSLHTPDVDDGQYSVSVNGTDGNGNYSVLQDVVEVVVDNTPPQVSVSVGFTSGDNLSGGVALSVVSIYDLSGVMGAEACWRSGDDEVMCFPLSFTGGIWSLLFDTALLQDGPYSLRFLSTDYANNRNFSQGFDAVVDNNKPSIELIDPVEGSNLSGELLFNAYVTDSGTGVEDVLFLYKAQGGSSTLISITEEHDGYWTASLDTTELPDGIYELGVLAYDFLNHQSSVFDRRVLVDNTAPEVSLVTPLNGTFSGTLGFSARSTDGLSGVKSVEFGYARQGGDVRWFPGRETQPGVWNGSLNTKKIRNGVYNVSVRSTDSAGSRKVIPDVLEITFSNKQARSRSSGGGGGSRRLITPVAVNDSSQSRVWDRLAAGSTTSFTVTRSGIPVSLVQFTVTESISNAELTVAAQDEKPSQLSGSYYGPVYRYVTMVSSNIGDSSVSSVSIGFRVNRSFVSENEASPDDVVLLLHDGSQWNELVTRSNGSDAGTYYYEAESSALSAHAIALGKMAEPVTRPYSVAVPIVVVNLNEVNETSAVDSSQPPSAPVAPVQPDVPVQSGSSGFPGMGNLIYVTIGVIAVIMLAGAIVVIYVTRRDEKPADQTANPDAPAENFENVPDDVTFDSFEDPYDLDRTPDNAPDERKLRTPPDRS